MHCDTAEAETL